jgi:hypothetical protein
MFRSEGGIPESVRSDIERGVAEARNLGDLRRGVEALVPQGTLRPDHDEVDLVVMWVWINYGGRWPASVRDEDTLRPAVNGSMVAAIQTIDLYCGADPSERILTPTQRGWMEAWEAHCRTEHR